MFEKLLGEVEILPMGDHFEYMGLFLTHGIEGTDMITSVFRDYRGEGHV
jgi:hypothetical protein